VLPKVTYQIDSIWSHSDVQQLLCSEYIGGAMEYPQNNYSHFVVVIRQDCSGDKIEKNELGGACSTYGGEERRI
jgi:hypothetical protein